MNRIPLPEKSMALYLFLVLLPAMCLAQPYAKVAHSSGMQLMNGYAVTVTSINFAGTNSACGTSPFHIGKIDNVTDGYRIEISPPTDNVRFEISGSDHNEEIEFYVNGSHYPISTSELSSYPGTCNGGFYAYVMPSGNISFSGPIVGLNAGTKVDIRNQMITSVEIKEKGLFSGSVVSFYFMRDTVLYIDSVNSDAFCQGDSIYVKYWAANFIPGNKFILQLSDTDGNFTNPLALDSLSLTISGIIKTVIPASVPPSNDYKIRVISRFPYRLSNRGAGVDIAVKLKPSPPAISSNAPVCPAATLNLSAVSPTSGVSYSWAGPGAFTSNSAAPSRSSMTAAQAGNYIATATLNGCKAADTLAVSVYPPTPKPTAGSNTPVCVGGDIKLNASSITGATYNWGGPVLYNATVQSPTRANTLLTHKGKYWVTASVNGCLSPADTTVVNVVQGPSVAVYPSPGDTICAGSDVTFSASPTNAGASPTYQWYKNGVFTGATGASYKTSAATTGDTFYVKMNAGTVCNTAISSNSIRMTVIPALPPPTINITSTPGTHVWPYVEVTFKANTVNAGIKPGYQWKRNGADIPNAKDSILKMTNLVKGDTICCVVTSNHLCAVPRTVKSNCLVMNVDLGVNEQAVEAGGSILIYPNPNKGNFTLKTKEHGIFHITDIRGQMITKYEMIPGDNRIQLPTGTAKGIYIGKFSSTSGITQTIRIVYAEN